MLEPKSQIQNSTREIRLLRQRADETGQQRDKSLLYREAWESAWNEFNARYESLAFPGGVSTAHARLRSGDREAIEYALCFIEIRPYFFRSGYMYNHFLRILRNCDLTTRQRDRYNEIYSRYLAYRNAPWSPQALE